MRVDRAHIGSSPTPYPAVQWRESQIGASKGHRGWQIVGTNAAGTSSVTSDLVTFYNAEEHFETAERIRIENLGSNLPSRAIQEYGKAIEKSEKVLREYSDSRYVKNARLLKGKSHYFRREYDSAVSIFSQLIQEKDFNLEAKYWLALCKWKDLKPQPAINDLKNLISGVESDEFKSRIFLSIGEIYSSINDSVAI